MAVPHETVKRPKESNDTVSQAAGHSLSPERFHRAAGRAASAVTKRKLIAFDVHDHDDSIEDLNPSGLLPRGVNVIRFVRLIIDRSIFFTDISALFCNLDHSSHSTTPPSRHNDIHITV